jgi:hypothetical protein
MNPQTMKLVLGILQSAGVLLGAAQAGLRGELTPEQILEEWERIDTDVLAAGDEWRRARAATAHADIMRDRLEDT